MLQHATTLVTFPTGATEGASAVRELVPLGVPELPAGGLGLIVDTTPFHPVDHTWPDQPGDSGTVLVDGVRSTPSAGGCSRRRTPAAT